MTTDALLAGTMAEMTAPEIVAAARRGAGALLPIGVMEIHGPHLPIGTDAYIASALCRLTQRYAAEQGIELLIVPPFYWGVNHVMSAFPGTFRIRREIATGLLSDIIDTLLDNALGEVLLVSHHGDLEHNKVLLEVVEQQQRRGHSGVRWLYAPFRWRLYGRLGCSGKEPFWVPWEMPHELEDLKTTGILGVHADEIETAAMARYYPDLVAFDLLPGLKPTSLGERDLERWRKGGEDARAVTPDGYFGAPQPIDPDLWRHYDYTARAMAAAVVSARRRP